ncbi:MAG: ABC transporter permease [Chloroflexi bacterium]|nr:ABC transporter permease [Chloroflexota bacterium]
MKKTGHTLVLMSPSGLWLIAFFLIPLAIMAVYSFGSGSFDLSGQSFSLDTYVKFFNTPSFLNLLWRSTVIAFYTALLSVLMAYPIAYFLAFQAGSWRASLLTIIIIPSWISYLLRILAIKLILGSSGLLNSLLLGLGLVQESVPLLMYSRSAVMITLVYTWIPFAALPIFSALERIGKPLLEAASDLGSPPWKAFLRVTLPLSLPGVWASFFFVFIPTLGEWVTPALMGGPQGIMYGNLIQDQFVRALNWPMGSVMSMVMTLLVIIFLMILTRFIKLSELLEG